MLGIKEDEGKKDLTIVNKDKKKFITIFNTYVGKYVQPDSNTWYDPNLSFSFPGPPQTGLVQYNKFLYI